MENILFDQGLTLTFFDKICMSYMDSIVHTESYGQDNIGADKEVNVDIPEMEVNNENVIRKIVVIVLTIIIGAILLQIRSSANLKFRLYFEPYEENKKSLNSFGKSSEFAKSCQFVKFFFSTAYCFSSGHQS